MNKLIDKKVVSKHLDTEIKGQNERWTNLTIRLRGAERELQELGEVVPSETKEQLKVRDDLKLLVEQLNSEINKSLMYIELEIELKRELKK